MTESGPSNAVLALFSALGVSDSVAAPSLVPALGAALLQSLWQCALIALCAALALSLLRAARPQARYAVACVAMSLCLLAPVVSLWHGLRVPSATAALAAIGDDAWLAAPSMSAAAQTSTWSDAILPWGVGFWAVGAGLMLLRIAAGMVWVGRLRDRAQPPTLAEWQPRLDALAHRFGLNHVLLAVSAEGVGPMTIGFLRPVILVPAAVLGRMPAEWIEALLAHELAHIRRHDYLINLLQRGIEALLFYHPAVWWLSHRISHERELVADRLAVDVLGEPRRLALALSELERFSLSPATLAQTAHGGQLMSRIQSLLRPGRPQTGGVLLPLAGLAVTAIAFYVYAESGPSSSVAPTTRTVAMPTKSVVDASPTALANAHHPASAKTAAQAAAAQTNAAIAEGDAAMAQQNAAMAGRDNAAAKRAAAAATRNASEAERNAAEAERNAAEAARNRMAVHHGRHHSGRPGYALISAGSEAFSMSGDLADIEAIRDAQRRFSGDFLWFRRNDKAYVMRDAELLSRARRELAAVSAHDAKMEAVGAEMERHGRKMEAIGRKMEGVPIGIGDTAAMREATRRLEALAAEQGALAARVSAHGTAERTGATAATQAAAREHEIEAITRRMEAIEQAMTRQQALIEAEAAQIETRARPLEALEREMEAAGRPMAALQEKMEVLAAEQQRAVAAADREIQALIEEAVRAGKALPADRSQ